MLKRYLLFFSLVLAVLKISAQNKPLPQEVKVDSSFASTPYEPLRPARAAFYSAVLPGLGQAYNKKYWKIPIVYGGMATGIVLYIRNNNDYNRFRNAYKRRLDGFTDDEFYGDGPTPIISNNRLIDAQRSAQKNKDYSILFTALVYILNIVDANVDAHLKQFNVNKNLSVSPKLQYNPLQQQAAYGLSLKLTVK